MAAVVVTQPRVNHRRIFKSLGVDGGPDETAREKRRRLQLMNARPGSCYYVHRSMRNNFQVVSRLHQCLMILNDGTQNITPPLGVNLELARQSSEIVSIIQNYLNVLL